MPTVAAPGLWSRQRHGLPGSNRVKKRVQRELRYAFQETNRRGYVIQA